MDNYIVNNKIFHDQTSDKKYRIIGFLDNYVHSIELETNNLKVIKREVDDFKKCIGNRFTYLQENDISEKTSNYINDCLSEKSRSRFEERKAIVSIILKDDGINYILNKKTRRSYLEKISKKKDISLKSAYKYIRIYLQGGKGYHSLVPDYTECGAPGKRRVSNQKLGRPSYVYQIKQEWEGSNLTDEDRTIFKKAIKKYKIGKISLRQVYDLMNRDFYSVNVDGEIRLDRTTVKSLDTFRQFYYKSYSKKEMNIMKNGEVKDLLKNPIVLKDTLFLVGEVGAQYEIDATISDYHLVSSIDRSSYIGRAVLYFVVDTFSKSIVGFNVGLNSPSWDEAALALLNCNEDKVKYCEDYGVKIDKDDWIQKGLPSTILGDRGEIISKYAENLVEELGVTISNTASMRADNKPNVEVRFRIINNLLKEYVPGYVRNKPGERMTKDSRKEATLTLDEFRKVVIRSIILLNSLSISKYPRTSEMVRNKVPSIPNAIWNYGLETRNSITVLPNKLLEVSLFRKGSGFISSKGIEFNEKTYMDAEEKLMDSVYISSAKKKKIKVEIRYRMNDLSDIYVLHNKEMVKCHLVFGKTINIEVSKRHIIEIQKFDKMIKTDEKIIGYEQAEKRMVFYNDIGEITDEASSKRFDKVNIKKVTENRKKELKINRYTKDESGNSNSKSKKYNEELVHLSFLKQLLGGEDE